MWRPVGLKIAQACPGDNNPAVVTRTLRLSTMVSPATFRHPSELAKLVTTADMSPAAGSSSTSARAEHAVETGLAPKGHNRSLCLP
jgi:hypothetical protein